MFSVFLVSCYQELKKDVLSAVHFLWTSSVQDWTAVISFAYSPSKDPLIFQTSISILKSYPISKFAGLAHWLGCTKYDLQLLSLLLCCPQSLWLPVLDRSEYRWCTSESAVFIKRRVFGLRTHLIGSSDTIDYSQNLWKIPRNCKEKRP